jgi:hypothetical protein
VHQFGIDKFVARFALSAQMRCSTLALWLLIPFLGASTACDSAPSGECSIGADCASGVCGDDGQCNTNAPTDGGFDGQVGDSDATTSACGSVVDLIITRDELPMAAGGRASFRVAADATFDTAGDTQDGLRSWDLDRPLANDVDTEVVLLDTSGSWYAESFPGASYASKLAQGSDLLGVFELSDTGLYLLGVVSPEPGLTRTELAYEPPVVLMPLPLEQGDSWSTDAQVSGVTSGVFTLYSERYDGMADESGELITPFGRFRVLRTRMDLTRTVGLLVTTTRQFNFVSECAGIAASIVSQNNEASPEFSSALEIRRVIP